MANSRIKDLIATLSVSELQTLLAELYYAVDNGTFSEAKKVSWTSMLNSAIVTSNSNNYQALTPKGFYDSIMTTARNGVGQLSTDAEVTAKAAGSALITTSQIDTLEDVIKKDFFTVDGAPTTFHQNKDDVYLGAMAWQACWRGDLPTSSEGVRLSPTMHSGGTLGIGYCIIVVTSDTYGWSGVVAIPNSSSDQIITLGNGTFVISIPVSRLYMFVRAYLSNQTNVKISITANFTIN